MAYGRLQDVYVHGTCVYDKLLSPKEHAIEHSILKICTGYWYPNILRRIDILPYKESTVSGYA